MSNAPTQSANATTASSTSGQRVQWYRTPLDKNTLTQLNAKSDAKAWAQTLGHLGLLALSGGAAFYSSRHWAWWATLALVFAYGTCASFCINAVHELGHKSVFKTQSLNSFFVRVYSFIGWIHFDHFYNSHMRHHQYTSHAPDDLEVVLPMRLMVRHFFKTAFVQPRHMVGIVKDAWRLARGQFGGEWEDKLFPNDQPQKRQTIIRWARFLLIGHATITIVSLAMGWWLLPVLTSLAPMYGGWLFFLCNNTQHIGLQDDVADYRLCCRTFTLHPVAQFLYWHMNFHTEHHMYAAVPCYNLAQLHRAIKHDLPPCPHGLLATWQEIAAIQRKQDADPNYQHVALIPQNQTAQVAA